VVSKSLLNRSELHGDIVPEWIVKIQCAIFAVLWSITMLPNVLIFRNMALIFGAIIGLYVAIKNRDVLITKRAIPLIIIGALFVWVTLHLLFIGKNHELQWAEYQSLWKRAFLGSIFALGLGISLAGAKKNHWAFIFVGICGPILIFYCKYLAKFCASYFGFLLPEAMILTIDYHHHYYIPKISYVFYCLPALGIALGYLAELLKSRDMNWALIFVFTTVIIAVLGIFYLENIKNGFIYVFLLTLGFFLSIFGSKSKFFSVKSYLLLAILGFLIAWGVFSNFRTNDSWKSLVADSEVAIQMQPSEVWTKSPFSYPIKADGVSVSPTNFDRIFYLKIAIPFIIEHPLGYGLVHSSFGHIAREKYQYAPLIQSHSGWVDLILGLGIPGVAILLVASILAMIQISSVGSPWSIFGLWSLLSVVLLFITTEVSQKNFVDTYVWLVVMVAAIGLANSRGNSVTYNFE
jgi:hypothetical protein